MTRKYLLLTGILIALTVGACSGTHPELPPNPDELMHRGEKIYLEYCAECHQLDGMGWSHLYPRFAGNPIITLHDAEPIIVTVLYGQGSMPPFRDKLSPDDLAGVLTYIRNSWGNSAPAISPRQIH